jgi:hypothetical protein
MAGMVGSTARKAAAPVQGAARQVGRHGGPWLQRGARLGYAAKGVVYLTVGLIALTGIGGGKEASSRGAIATLAEQPAGAVLVFLIAVGLFGYAVWRLIEAATGAEGEGDDAKGIAKRLGHVGSGLAYAALGVFCVRLLLGGTSSGSGGGDRTDNWTARLLALPLGRALVVAVGLGVAGYGLYQLYRAARKNIGKRLALDGVGAENAQWVERVGRAGIGARGVVFVIIGGFLVQAARRSDASQAGGLPEALAAVERAPYGGVLLAIVALGLMAYGVYQLVNARWRRVATG